MARRLALLTLLACAVTIHCARHRSRVSDSDSLDSFDLWDDYEESIENSPTSRPSVQRHSAKVILKVKPPKVNTPVKNKKGAGKPNIIRATSISIESHTNFIDTKRPSVVMSKPKKVTKVPIEEDEAADLVEVTWQEGSKRRPSSTRRPPTNTPRRAPASRRPSTTRRPATSHKPTTRSKRPTPKTTQTTKKPCQKHSEWISSFFHTTKPKKTSKKPENSGLLTRIYNWIWSSTKPSWFSTAGWFQEAKETTTTTTSTTPPPTTTGSWFQMLLDSEEGDGAYVTENSVKKPAKKPVKKNYKGYQLLRAYPDVPWKVQQMLELQEEGQGSGLMWWTPPSLNSSTDLLVPPDLMEDVVDNLKSSKIQYDVIIRDLQNAINFENPRLSKKQRLELERSRGHPMTWRRYHRYADILRYLEYLQHSHADIVELVPLGRSSEGLPLVAVKVSLASNDSELDQSGSNKKRKLRSRMKPAVWLEGGAHAREWVSPAVVTWMLHALVEGEMGKNRDQALLKQVDFYIMPVLNPDGYEHSHTHDRLWRKTRSRLPDHSDDYFVGWFPWNWGRTECVGVDADRNWDYKWGKHDSSQDPCSENYAGAHPFSEPETRAVSEFLTEHRGQIKVYMSFHAYSQAWLVPSNRDSNFADTGELMEMSKLATAALAEVHGTKYKVGTVSEIHQPASGMSHDWAAVRLGIKFPYHIELPDPIGQYGFLLPGSQIVSTARETWMAVKAIVDNLNPG